MGGLVFANIVTDSGKPPHVPRMSPELYNVISADCQAKLETLFNRVVIPRDPPNKKDYGDIDFLVEGIQPPTTRKDIWRVVKDVFEAQLYLARGESHSYGITHPENPDAVVQVDVELSPGDDTADNDELFEWTRFMKGDSDLLQIVGISHRPLGTTCNDRGLYFRIPEIEPYNKKKALLFLTRDPNKVMEFYGYDVAKYWAGFTDENDLFDWATSGRFFSHSLFDGRVEKHNDRARQVKRPMYKRFVEDYMPANPDKGAANTWTKEQVFQEALTVFDRRAEYDNMMEEHHLKEAEEGLWKEIRARLPVEGNSLGMALKGLRRWVVFQNGQPLILGQASLDEHSLWTKSISTDDQRATVLKWVEENWQEVKSLEKRRANTAKEACKTL